jgi:transcriptional regulator with XRE-family HTH domain
VTGWELRAVRERLGLRSNQLALRLGIETFRVRQYEQGVEDIPWAIEQKLILTALSKVKRELASNRGEVIARGMGVGECKDASSSISTCVLASGGGGRSEPGAAREEVSIGATSMGVSQQRC